MNHWIYVEFNNNFIHRNTTNMSVFDQGYPYHRTTEQPADGLTKSIWLTFLFNTSASEDTIHCIND